MKFKYYIGFIITGIIFSIGVITILGAQPDPVISLDKLLGFLIILGSFQMINDLVNSIREERNNK